MVTTPGDTPVTTPVEPTVATAVLLLNHAPPDSDAVKVVEDVPHIVLDPLIVAAAFTVIRRYAPQPEPTI